MARIWPDFLSRFHRGQARRGVQAGLNYVGDTPARPVSHATDPSRTLMPHDNHQVFLHDLRSDQSPPSLEREGFTLTSHRSRVTDFADAEQIQQVYLPELEQIIRQLTGAPHVFVLAQPILRSQKHLLDYGAGTAAEGVAGLIHTDYTDSSVWPAAQAAMRRHGVEKPPGGRLVAYTMWRSVTPPPQDIPLALCDRSSVEESDLVRADSYGASGTPEYRSEFYVVRFNPRHRWCYFSDMNRDEALVFQQHDTGTRGVSGCPHSAFVDPSCSGDPPTRLSIEARLFAVFP